MDFQFGIKRRIYNWNMKQARIARGLKQKELGSLLGKSAVYISQIECLRTFPPPEIAEKISDILNTPLAALFPAWLQEFQLAGVPTPAEEQHFSLEEATAMGLLQPRHLISNPLKKVEDSVFNEQLRGELDAMIETLKPKQQKVIRLRFGLHGPIVNGSYQSKSRTLESLSIDMGCTREGVRQIEQAALRHLRGQSKRVKNFVLEPEPET